MKHKDQKSRHPLAEDARWMAAFWEFKCNYLRAGNATRTTFCNASRNT